MNSNIKNTFISLSSFLLAFESIFNKLYNNNSVLLYLHMYPDSYGNFDEINLRKNIKFLKENCNLVSLKEMFNVVYNGSNIPERTVAVTIDDAKQSFYTHGYPILKEFNIPFTLGIIPGLIERDERDYLISKLMRTAGHTFYLNHKEMLYRLAKWFEARGIKGILSFNDVFQKVKYLEDEAIKELIIYMKIPEEDFISWETLKSMKLDKNIKFASHTMSHPLLKFSNGEWLRWELEKSKKLIENNLKINIDTFILPYGDLQNYSFEMENELAHLGYKYALYTEKGVISQHINKLRIPRMNGEVKSNLFKIYTNASLCRAIFRTEFIS